MPNLSTEAIFILVKSLERAEKRNFKLYVKRNSASADLKTIQLFDALDKMKVYDQRSGKSSEIDAHIKEREAGIAAMIAPGVQSADKRADARLKQSGTQRD